jgi:hypothetical protein
MRMAQTRPPAAAAMEGFKAGWRVWRVSLLPRVKRRMSKDSCVP